MTDRQFPTRRRLLGYTGVLGLSGLAGCGSNPLDSDSEEDGGASPTPTDTVVFTGSSTQTATSTSTGTDTPTSAPTDTATDTPTEIPSPTGTPTPTAVTFDGGDIQALRDAFDACKRNPGATLEIEPGTYRFESMPREGPGPHLFINGLQDITIEGNGAKFVFTNPLRGSIYFVDCEGLTLRDLTIDYDPVPFTQGTITETSDNRTTIVVELDEGYPPLSHEMFDQAKIVSGRLHNQDGSFISGIKQRGNPKKRFSSIERIGDRRYELELSDQPGINARGIAADRRFSLVARGGLGVAHAMLFNDVDGLTIRDIRIHASPGFAISVALCGDPIIDNVTIAPPDESTRFYGSVADGIHCANCRDGPQIENCRLERLGDDGIIVDEKMTTAERLADERTVDVVARNSLTTIEPDDVLEVMSPQGERKGSLPPVSDVEYEERSYAKPDVVTFSEPVNDVLEPGDYLSNQSTNSGGFVVRNNTVRSSVANSVRICSENGVVEENELHGASIHNIRLICNTKGDFPPKRWLNDVEVTNNRLSGAGLTYFASRRAVPIKLVHSTPDDIESTGRPNRNIRISGNEISSAVSVGASLGQATGVEFTGNAMSALNRLRIRDGAGFGVGLTDVGDATVADNDLSGDDESLYGFLWQRDSDEVSVTGNTMSVDGSSVEPRSVVWEPVRLQFNKTARPAENAPEFAFRCFELQLLDSAGETIVDVNVGGKEYPADFDGGVFSPLSVDEGSARWFGGAEAVTTILFDESALSSASAFQIRGNPIEDGISAKFRIENEVTDEVEFDSREIATYSFELS